MRLANERYEEIKKTIGEFLEDYGVNKLPLDVFGLARRMKIKITFASELLEKHPRKIDEYVLLKYPNSYLYYDSETQKFIVYVDDVGCKRKRQRFSLAHELMHIILGHTEQNPVNEAEANFGATYLLAPTSLALIFPEEEALLRPEIASKIFDVSLPEAEIVVRYNSNRLSLSDISEKDYEKRINSLLKGSFMHQLSKYRQ